MVRVERQTNSLNVKPGRREFRRKTRSLRFWFLLSPAPPVRTLMCPARRFALGDLAGAFSGWERWTNGCLEDCVGFYSGRSSLWGSQSFAQAPTAKLADYFGFQPLELYKLDSRIGNLQLKDLDGDKIDDIIVTNNGRSRIDLLLSTKKAADDKAARPFRKDPNELKYDRRMRLVSIPVNKEIVSIDTGDFNGDGKPDLVFYGTPAEVEILFNEGQGHSPARKKSTPETVQGASWPLATWTRTAATTWPFWLRKN